MSYHETEWYQCSVTLRDEYEQMLAHWDEWTQSRKLEHIDRVNAAGQRLADVSVPISPEVTDRIGTGAATDDDRVAVVVSSRLAREILELSIHAMEMLAPTLELELGTGLLETIDRARDHIVSHPMK